MNNNKYPIDELLKQQLEHFAPEAPDVWQQVQSQVQATSEVTSTTAAAKTGLSVVAKTILLSASIVSLGVVSYVVFTNTQLISQDVSVQQDTVTTSNSIQSEVSNTVPFNEALQGEITVANIKPAEKTTKEEPAKQKNQIKPQQLKVMDNQIPVKEEKQSVSAQSTAAFSTNGTQATTELQEAAAVEKQPTVAPNKPEVQEKPTQKPSNQAMNQVDVSRVGPSMPGSFSPNGDGINDTYIIDIENEIFYQLTIRDKSEKIMFQSTDKNEHWDGNDRNTGKACEEDYYLAELVYQLKGDAKPDSKVKIFAIKRKN